MKGIKLAEKSNRKCFVDEAWGRLHWAHDPDLNEDCSHRDLGTCRQSHRNKLCVHTEGGVRWGYCSRWWGWDWSARQRSDPRTWVCTVIGVRYHWRTWHATVVVTSFETSWHLCWFWAMWMKRVTHETLISGVRGRAHGNTWMYLG